MSQPTVPQIEAPPQVPEEVLDDYLKAQILSLSSIVTKVIDLSDLATRNIPKPTSPPPQQQQPQQQSHAQQQDHKKKHFLSKNPFHNKHKDSQPISSPPPSLIKDDLIFTELIGKLEKLAKTGNIPGITISIQTRYGLINYYNTNKNYIKFEINPENFIELFNLFKLLPNLIELYSSNDLENYYIQLIEFIDLLLSCNSTINQRKTLLNLRRNIMSLEFQAIGEFDSNFTKNLSKLFNYNENDLLKKLNFLKNDINKNYEYEFLFITKGITSFYTERDFDNLKSFQKWESISNKLFNDLLNAYKSSIGITNTNDYKKIIPKNYSNTRDHLIELLLTSNSQFLFNGLTNCFKLWQIDPFQLQCDFLNKGYQIMSNNNFEIFDFTFALKIISLSMAISPVQLDLRDWPMGKRTEYFNALGKFHKNSQSTFEKVYEIFIDDPKSFSIASDFLEKLYPFGVPTKLLNDIHLKLSEIAESSLQNEFNKINDSVLHPSKNANPIQEFSTTIAKILVNAKNVEEIIDEYYIDKYNIKEILINNYLIIAFKNSQKIIDKIHKNKNLNISNPKESNVLIILDTLNLLKIETLELSSSSSINEENFDDFIGFHIQEILYKDLLNLVINLKSELENQVENSIKIDTLDRLPNVSYSSSVQNVFGLCDAYLKQIDNLNWKLQIQNGILKTYIFKFITSSLIYYCEIMSKRIYKELLSLNNNAYNGDMANFIAETCLNNIFQVLNLISKYQNQDTENISKLLNSDPQLVAKYTSGRKLVSIDILNCENIEDKRGNPLNMFVEILGPINGKTRTINRDYNPQWNESFDSVVNKNSSNLTINVKFDEKKLDTQPQIYKSIKYDLGLNSIDDYYSKEDKISLEPRPGNLNIEVTIQAERHDAVHYILNAIQRINKLKDRSIKLFVESYSNPYKTLFNKITLAKSLNINKMNEESSKKIFNLNLDRSLIYDDSIIHDYIFKLEGETFSKLYNNLETNCFDDVILQLYKNIISIAINLILPRLSSVDQKITSRLNKRSSLTNRIFKSSSSSSSSSSSASHGLPSSFNSSPSSQDIQNTNPSLAPSSESYLSSKSGMYVSNNQEIRRVFEWIQALTNCFFNNTEVLQQPLIPIYERAKKIWYNYQIDNRNLKTSYFNSWKIADRYIIKNCVNRRINHSFNFSERIRFDNDGRIIRDQGNADHSNDKMDDVLHEREIILRIILLRSGGSGSDYKFVVNSLEQIQRYKRSIETELEYEILVGRF